jgi:hypothetical protein
MDYHTQLVRLLLKDRAKDVSQAGRGWLLSVILALVKLRQEDQTFQASLGYKERTCLKTNKKCFSMEKYKHFQGVCKRFCLVFSEMV